VTFWQFLNHCGICLLVMLGLVGVFFRRCRPSGSCGRSRGRNHEADVDWKRGDGRPRPGSTPGPNTTPTATGATIPWIGSISRSGAGPFMVVLAHALIFTGFSGLFFKTASCRSARTDIRLGFFPLSLLRRSRFGLAAVKFVARAVAKLVDVEGAEPRPGAS